MNKDMHNQYLDFVRYRQNIGHVNAHGSTLRLPKFGSSICKRASKTKTKLSTTKPAPTEPTSPCVQPNVEESTPTPTSTKSRPAPAPSIDDVRKFQYEIERRDEQIKVMQTRLTQSQQRQQELEATLLSFEADGEQEKEPDEMQNENVVAELKLELEKVLTMLDNTTIERDEHARRAEALSEGISARKKEISELKDKLELSDATIVSLEQELRAFSSSQQVDDFHPDEDYSRAKMKQMEREVRSLFGSLSMVEKYVCELDVAAGQLPADEPSFDHIRTLTSGLSNALDTEMVQQE